jgi:hypothetical protein
VSAATAFTTDAASQPDGSGVGERRRGRGWAWFIGAVIVAAVAGAGISALGHHWLAVGDDATIEMLVRDVGSHTPLVGFNSRFTWNHPGPWTFWLLAVPYRLSGDSSAWLLVGAGLVNAAAVAGFAWVAFRRGGLTLLVWAGFLLLVLCRSTGYVTLRDPWNPWIAVLSFALFVLAVWAVVEGDLPVMPVALLAGSFCLNNHAGYLALSLGIGAWMLAWVVANAWRVRRGHDPDAWSAHRRRLVLWGAVSAGVLVVFWAPVLYEQLFAHHPGNLTRMYHFFVEDDAPKTTTRHALDIFGSEVGLRAPWLGWSEPVSRMAEYRPEGAWTAVVTVGVFVATGVWAWRRHAWDAVRLHATVGFTFVVGLASIWQLRGTQYPYLFRWSWVIGMFLVLASGWAVYRGLQEGPRVRLTRVGVPVLGSAIVALALLTVTTQWSDPLPLQAFERQARALVRPTVAALHGDDHKVFVTPAGYGLVVPFGAVVSALEDEGVEVRVPNKFFIAYGRHRALAEGETATQVVTVAETTTEISRLEADPNQRLLAKYVPRGKERTRDRLAPIAVFVSDQTVTGQAPPIPWG